MVLYIAIKCPAIIHGGLGLLLILFNILNSSSPVNGVHTKRVELPHLISTNKLDDLRFKCQVNI